MPLYAWAPIRYGADVDEDGNITKVHEVKLGDEVTQTKIKASDSDWNYLCEAGVVREEKYPVDEGRVHPRSPREIRISKAKAEYEAASEGLKEARGQKESTKKAETKTSGTTDAS